MSEKREMNLEDMTTEQLEMIALVSGSIARKRRIDSAVKKARSEGKAFEKLEDIPGKDGHVHKYHKLEYSGGWEMGVAEYRCDECTEFNEFLQVYECPNCGYVPQRYLGQEHYDDTGPLCGSAGEHQYCGICGDQIGTIVTMHC